MINFVQPGGTIEITAPTGGVTSGEPVQIGGIIGIGALDALVSESVNIQVEGVFDVDKVSAQAWAEGESIYWDDTAELMTTVKGGIWAGIAVAAAANPSSTGRMRMNPGNERGLHIGLSAVPLVDDSVDVVFMSGYFDSGATSGDSKGLAIVLEATGASQDYSTAIYGKLVVPVELNNPCSISGDVEFGVAGSVTGLCYGIGTYFSFPAAVMASGGNYAGVNIEFALPANCDIGTPGSGGATRVAMLRFAVSGDTTAKATFEDTGTAMSFVGFTEGSDMIINSDVLTIGAGDPANVIGLRVGIGTGAGQDAIYYIPLVPEAEWN